MGSRANKCENTAYYDRGVVMFGAPVPCQWHFTGMSEDYQDLILVVGLAAKNDLGDHCRVAVHVRIT